MFCIKCGKKNNDNSTFCGFCGAVLIHPYAEVSSSKLSIKENILCSLKTNFVAFDLETTGLDTENDRIIEIGAVKFENLKPVKQFNTLVNPKMVIPPRSTKVNRITNQMVQNAPNEFEMCQMFIKFLGCRIDEKLIFCAHNASFDVKFLSKSFLRNYIKAKIVFIDTLIESKRQLKYLKDHKLQTVAEHFGITNENAHRAYSDAIVCGKILCNLLDITETETKKKNQRSLDFSEFETSLLKTTEEILKKHHVAFDKLYLDRTSLYTDICYKNYTMLRFKIGNRLQYWLIDMNQNQIKKKYTTDVTLSPATKSEGGDNKSRVIIEDANLLIQFEQYILDRFEKCKSSYEAYEKWIGDGKTNSYSISVSFDYDENGKPKPIITRERK